MPLRGSAAQGLGAAAGAGVGALVALGVGAGEGATEEDGAGATVAAVTGVALDGAVVLVDAIALSEHSHNDVHPFQVELESLITLQVTTPQFVPVVQGLAVVPAAPRSHACACPS
jgi:outer membrane lipoprotein SlyB